MAKYDSELVNQKLINRFTGTHSKGENNADLVNQRLLQRLTAGYINAQPQTQDVLSSKVVSKALPVVKQPEKSQAYDYSVSLKNVLSRQKQGQDTHLMQEYLAQGKTGLDNAYYEKRIQELKDAEFDPLTTEGVQKAKNITEDLKKTKEEYYNLQYESAPKIEKQYTEKLQKIDEQLSKSIDEGARTALEAFREQTQKDYDAFHGSDAAKTYRYDQRQKSYGEQLQDKALEQQVKKLYSVSTHEKTKDNVDGVEVSAGDTQAEYNDIFRKLEEDGYNPDGLLDYYTRQQNAIAAEKQRQEDEKFAEEHPVLASAKSIGMAPFKAFGMLDTGISALNEAITGELHPVDTNAKDFLATRTQGTIREKVSENMEGWQRFCTNQA